MLYNFGNIINIYLDSFFNYFIILINFLKLLFFLDFNYFSCFTLKSIIIAIFITKNIYYFFLYYLLNNNHYKVIYSYWYLGFILLFDWLILFFFLSFAKSYFKNLKIFFFSILNNSNSNKKNVNKIFQNFNIQDCIYKDYFQ